MSATPALGPPINDTNEPYTQPIGAPPPSPPLTPKQAVNGTHPLENGNVSDEHTPVDRVSTPGPYPQPTAPSHPSIANAKLISNHLEAYPHHSAGRAINTLFPKPHPIIRLLKRFAVKHSVISGLSEKEEKHWQTEGTLLRKKAGWKLEGEEGDGTVISELFWKMYLSLMPTLQRDPLSGLVPPDLLGSTSTMPLTIISLIPDIMQHYHDVIIRARKEVFLATNYWQPSNSVNTISGSLRQLSDLVLKEKRERVVVKIIYDRGAWSQFLNAHAPVQTDGWSPLDIPTPDEIKGLHLEVVNYHRMLLGTFHAKFLIVDRKVALINSNNIQDRPNLELMSHLEGPIVDSFYEVALHSWWNKFNPPLPCMSTPYRPPTDKYGHPQYLFQHHNPYFDDIEILKAAKAARLLLRRQTKDLDLELETGRERFRDAVKKVVDQQRSALADWKPGEELEKRAQDAMEQLRDFRDRLGHSMGMPSRPGSRSNSRGPSRRASAMDTTLHPDPATQAATAQNAVINAPSEAPSSPTLAEHPKLKVVVPKDGPHVAFAPMDSQDAVTMSPVEATKSQPLLASDMVDSPAASSLRLALGEGTPVNEKGERLPVTAQTPDEMEKPARLTATRADSEMPPEGAGSKRMYKMAKMFNAAGVLSEAWATVDNDDELDNFKPHVVHKPHEPLPMAMVCRKPHGFPGHHDIRNPQNAAWLAGFRYAKKNCFVQTPTLNARPIVRAIIQACQRGVEVTLLLDLGFNDKGESIPFQGGTNEEVVERLYKQLRKVNKEQFLKVYWYTGKDQVRPLNAVKKQRNCHIKFAAYDDEVLIIGNGNQDSQSWFHSQEINIMVDSKQIITEMMETLLSNQNTMRYGLVDTDGIWRDKHGKTLEDYGATAKGAFRGLSAFMTFAKSI
ncbi:hypothetical protein BCR39DRAFT_541162 [Naematelia encephala]|uniref:PLD phosphodiesterase domain-containing protein n=1 Tax=Naematelia encephala TaxID=71784 RepID=A0A1Y2AUN0_9TREE|nr:hypothetical protein BCR39DRAFT_541162 [Naematelia encephala]